MAMNADHFNTHDNFKIAGKIIDQVSALKQRNAELEKENAALKAEIEMLKNHIANGDVSRITWIDELAELKEERRWRKFSEEKPEDGQSVWAYEPNRKLVLKLEYEKSDTGEGFICFPYKHEFYPGITLWMPFEVPKAPEGK